jgi:hypothetical protein
LIVTLGATKIVEDGPQPFFDLLFDFEDDFASLKERALIRREIRQGITKPRHTLTDPNRAQHSQ